MNCSKCNAPYESSAMYCSQCGTATAYNLAGYTESAPVRALWAYVVLSLITSFVYRIVSYFIVPALTRNNIDGWEKVTQIYSVLGPVFLLLELAVFIYSLIYIKMNTARIAIGLLMVVRFVLFFLDKIVEKLRAAEIMDFNF